MGGVKINHSFVARRVLESMTADICEAAATDGGDDWDTVIVMTMTVMTAGGFIFSEVVGRLQSYLYI